MRFCSIAHILSGHSFKENIGVYSFQVQLEGFAWLENWVGLGYGLSLGVSETVKFVARHTKLCDLLRIFNLARALSHVGSKKG